MEHLFVLYICVSIKLGVMSKSRNNILGIFLILLDSFSLAALYAVTKITTQDLKSSYVVFLYKFSLFLITLPWVLNKGGINNIRTPAFKVHLLRGFLSVGGSLSFMYGLQYISILDATILQNIEQVVLVLIGMLFFNEKVSKTKILSILLGVIGVLIVVNPRIVYNFDLFSVKINHGYLFILLAVMFWVGNNIAIKKLGQNSTNKAQIFYLMLFSSIFAYPVAFLKWNSLEVLGTNLLLPVGTINFSDIAIKFSHLKLIFMMSLFYLVHSISLFNALKVGEFSVVMPFVYFKLLWAGIFGYFIFSTLPEPSSWLGYFLIAAAGLLLMNKEIRNKKVNAEESF